MQKATQSKEKTERAEIIETAQMDILGKQTENQGSISENELYEILTSEDYHTQGTVEGDPSESILNATLISNDGKYEIKVYEIYNGEFSEEDPIEPIGPLFPIVMTAFLGPDGVNYSFDSDMNWTEWVNSSYNTTNFMIRTNSSSDVPTQFRGIEGVWFNGRPVINPDGNYVLPNDKVSAYGRYTNAIW